MAGSMTCWNAKGRGAVFRRGKAIERLLRLCLTAFILFCSSPAFCRDLVLNTADIYPLSTPEGSGFIDLIVKEAFRRMGLRVKIIVEPSERALVNADKGIDDGNFVRIAGLERIYHNLVFAPEKICEFEFAAFTTDPAVRIGDWSSLKPYDVGIVTGWKILEANIVGTKSLTKVKDPEALFDLLANHRVDLVVFDRMQGNAIIKRKGLSGIVALEPLLVKREMFLYLNRRHGDLVPGLADVLREMKRDGTYQGIIDSVLNQSGEERP